MKKKVYLLAIKGEYGCGCLLLKHEKNIICCHSPDKFFLKQNTRLFFTIQSGEPTLLV
jgi:hypothetical protein